LEHAVVYFLFTEWQNMNDNLILKKFMSKRTRVYPKVSGLSL
jgi:hypothetical protein